MACRPLPQGGERLNLAGMSGTVIETLLRRDQRVTLASLAVVSAVAWVYTLSGPGMPVPGSDGMEGMSADAHAIMLARAHGRRHTRSSSSSCGRS
jgi:predicted metal-binding membrane protein